MLSTLALLSLMLVSLFGCAYFIIKIVDWLDKRRFMRFKNQQAEFLSDMYKTQQKWCKKGCFDYAKGIQIIIDNVAIAEEPEAETEYGKMIKRALRDAEKDDQP